MFPLSYMFYVQFCCYFIARTASALLFASKLFAGTWLHGSPLLAGASWAEDACYAPLTHQALQLFWEPSQSGRLFYRFAKMILACQFRNHFAI